MSGSHRRMFKPGCLVFPFRWLKGQAGLCLAPSHLPSRFPVKGGVVPRAAYLRNRCGICRPFCFDRADGGDESWICHCPLTAHSQSPLSPAWCLSTRLGGKWNVNSWRQAHLSPAFHLFCFPGGALLDPPEALSPLLLGQFIALPHLSSVFLRKSKQANGKNQMCFFFCREGDKISALNINCCLELVV